MLSPRQVATARAWALPLLLLAYVAGLFSYMAFEPPGLFERDGYFHARFARMMPERGLSREFPWTQASTWKDRFCDKELFYHLLMMPFAQVGAEPLRGTQVFVLLLSLSVLVALFFVLRAHRVRWPLFFVFVTLSMGGLFLARLTMIRSHVLSMLLQVIGLHLLLHRRWRSLALLGFVYAWSYTVPFALLMTSGMFAAGRWLGRGGLDWRSVLASGLGTTAGLVIHPYSPLTLETFLTYVEVMRLGLSSVPPVKVELGNEIYPLAPRVFMDLYPLLGLAALALPVLAWLRRRRLTPGTTGAVVAALFWFGMTLASARFAEYSVLLVSAAWALVVRDALAGPGAGAAPLSARPRLRAALALAFLALALGLHVRCLRFYTVYRHLNPGPRFRGAAAWMARNLDRGEVVLNLHWDDLPELLYDGYRQRYLWGLDPTYTLRHDRELALLLERTNHGWTPIKARLLRKRTGADYMILRSTRARRFPQLMGGQLPEVYRDTQAVIYSLTGW